MDTEGSAVWTGPTATFRVSVSLAHYFSDERALCYMAADSARSARWLARRVRRTFALPHRLALLCRGHLLPPGEPLALLRPEDLLEVIPANSMVVDVSRERPPPAPAPAPAPLQEVKRRALALVALHERRAQAEAEAGAGAEVEAEAAASGDLSSSAAPAHDQSRRRRRRVRRRRPAAPRPDCTPPRDDCTLPRPDCTPPRPDCTPPLADCMPPPPPAAAYPLDHDRPLLHDILLHEHVIRNSGEPRDPRLVSALLPAPAHDACCGAPRVLHEAMLQC